MKLSILGVAMNKLVSWLMIDAGAAPRAAETWNGGTRQTITTQTGTRLAAGGLRPFVAGKTAVYGWSILNRKCNLTYFHRRNHAVHIDHSRLHDLSPSWMVVRRAGCSSCSMDNSFVSNVVLIERAVSCWHLHQLISQTTQYVDSWLSDLLQSELKIKLLKV